MPQYVCEFIPQLAFCSLGLWVPGCDRDKLGGSGGFISGAFDEKIIFSQSLDVLHWTGHWDTVFKRCTATYPGGTNELQWDHEMIYDWLMKTIS